MIDMEENLYKARSIMVGTGELLLILCVALILFGGKKLPEFAKNLGKGIHEFKKACGGLDDDDKTPPPHP